MAGFIKGTLTVTTGGTAQNLNLGWIPSYFRMVNKTKLAATTNGVVIAEWFDDMANGSANIWTTSAGDGTNKITQISSNGVTPLITADPNLFVPNQAPYTTQNRTPMGVSTNLKITGISQAANASITATHSFTSADIGVTVVTFHGVLGMTQINTLSGVIQSVNSTTDFTVNINTTNFSAYTSSGVANVITGAPASTTYGNQILNTAEANLGIIGLTLGTSLMVTTSDVWEYVAYLQSPTTGP